MEYASIAVAAVCRELTIRNSRSGYVGTRIAPVKPRERHLIFGPRVAGTRPEVRKMALVNFAPGPRRADAESTDETAGLSDAEAARRLGEFWQEYKADTAISALKQRLALRARVLRGGRWRELPARELVPGEVVLTRLGNIVPADVRLIEGDYLSVDQSALTGESLLGSVSQKLVSLATLPVVVP